MLGVARPAAGVAVAARLGGAGVDFPLPSPGVEVPDTGRFGAAGLERVPGGPIDPGLPPGTGRRPGRDCDVGVPIRGVVGVEEIGVAPRVGVPIGEPATDGDL